MLKPDDTVYFIGDACDRGPDGWRIIKEILDDKRFIYIRGNHEQMLIDVINNPEIGKFQKLHYANGGYRTEEAMTHEEEQLVYDVIGKLMNTSLKAVYTNTSGKTVYMSHSGAVTDDAYDLIWDRNRLFFNVDEYDFVVHGHTPIMALLGDLKLYYRVMKIDEIPEWNGGAFRYCRNKIDIDCATYVTGRSILLNLDTFEDYIITID